MFGLRSLTNDPSTGWVENAFPGTNRNTSDFIRKMLKHFYQECSFLSRRRFMWQEGLVSDQVCNDFPWTGARE